MARAVLLRFLLFLLLWVVLSGGVWRDPEVAAIGIAAATVASLVLWPRHALTLRWRGLPGLLAHFFGASIQGGIDVAFRALAPSMPLRPELIRVECRLTPGAGLVLFVWMISLMPGTASVGLDDDGVITVHLVDSQTYGEDTLRRLEDHIARFI
jgi:multicomponent Na+:H+ antiporter subunit E